MNKAVSNSNLSQKLNILLHTDGTVTDLLELIVNEDIYLEKASESINENNSILNREIYLIGSQTKMRWVFAKSKIYLNQLPENFSKDLLNKSIPIGTLWNRYKLETYKQVTEVFEESNTELFENNQSLICRSYQVYSNKQLIMEITEKFPISYY